MKKGEGREGFGGRKVRVGIVEEKCGEAEY